MTTYIKLSDLIRQNYPKEVINTLLAEILEVTLPAKSDYPDYQTWFLEKQVPGLFKGNRDIVLAIHKGEIVGVASLKKDTEKKICTLYIKPQKRKRKEGILLVEQAIKILETEKPLITMPVTKVREFYPIIKKYGWVLSDEIDDCYKENTKELIFNHVPEPLSRNDSLSEVLEKIYQKKNSGIIKFRWRYPIVQYFLKFKNVFYH